MGELLTATMAQAWTVLGYIGPFLFVLGLVIFVHEYGHYIVGRWCGVGIDAFSLGFGPKLFGWQDKHGTEWKLCAIPLGGYVKFRGDLNAASMPDDSEAEAIAPAERAVTFQFKPVWQRAAIVAAGPIANFLLAIAIFAGSFMLVGRYVIEPVVDKVIAGSPAAAAGVQPGDRVISINGHKVASFDDLRTLVTSSQTDLLQVEVVRQGLVVPVDIQSRVAEQKTAFGVIRHRIIGVAASTQPEFRRLVTYGPVDAVVAGTAQVGEVITQSVKFLGRLVVGREQADQLSGPIRIAQVSGKVAEAGILSLLSLVAFVSVSIGFVNLLPIPILDGGHLMFYAYEAMFGRPLSRRSQDVFYRIGFVLVMALMAFSVVNDVIQIAR